MKVGFLLIVLEHTAVDKRGHLAMKSVIGQQREALILLGPYPIANYLFTNYMKQRSMPTYLRIWITSKLLPKTSNNWVFILDSASFQKRKDIKENIISAGHALFFRPTYSPDLNKVEK